jgi:glucokinase
LVAKLWAGIDLGGTWVRAAVSNNSGHLKAKIAERVDKSSAEAVGNQMIRLVRFLCDRQGVDLCSLEGVGVAATGPLVQEEGILMHPTALKFDRVLVTKPISSELGVPCVLINDAAAAALGEKTFGAAKNLDNYVYITISTGIGCGAIVNGTLLSGKDGNAHEVGHIVIDCEGRLVCGCGKRGHWEAYCSGSNIPGFVRMKLGDESKKVVRESLLSRAVKGNFSRLTTEGLFISAREGDVLATRLVKEIGVLNAMGVASVINVYDPSLITIGGTVTLRNQTLILDPIKKGVSDYVINRIPEIKVTPLGDDIGLYGAVAAAKDYVERSSSRP